MDEGGESDSAGGRVELGGIVRVELVYVGDKVVVRELDAFWRARGARTEVDAGEAGRGVRVVGDGKNVRGEEVVGRVRV